MTLTRCLRTASAMAAILAFAAPAVAEAFTLFIYETQDEIALRDDTSEEGAAYWAAWTEFNAGLVRAGAVRGGAPLIPSGVLESADGLVLGGYFVIEAADEETAEDFAAAAPSSARGGRTVVARHLATPPAMDTK